MFCVKRVAQLPLKVRSYSDSGAKLDVSHTTKNYDFEEWKIAMVNSHYRLLFGNGFDKRWQTG